MAMTDTDLLDRTDAARCATPASPSWITEQPPQTLASLLTDKAGAIREVAFTCPLHGEQRDRVVKFTGGEWAEPKCHVCADEAKQADERARAEREAATAARQTAQARARYIEKCGIPLRFAGKTFEGYRPEDDEQRKARDLCSRYAEQFATSAAVTGEGLILCGTPGTGKTHVSTAAPDPRPRGSPLERSAAGQAT